MGFHWHTCGIDVCCIFLLGQPNTQSLQYIPGRKQEDAKEAADGELNIRIEPCRVCSLGEAEKRGLRREGLGHGTPYSPKQDRSPISTCRDRHWPHSQERCMGAFRNGGSLKFIRPLVHNPLFTLTHTPIYAY